MKSKVIITSTCLLTFFANVIAQNTTETEDTTKFIENHLDEVVIVADREVINSEKTTIIPTVGQKQSATNGIDLINHLMIPNIQVNILNENVETSAGEYVQLCINGRNAKLYEIKAILPSDIIKVEKIDYPGVRYNNAAAMINYVVKRHDTGGSIGYWGSQSLKSWDGGHGISAKMNHRSSEFTIFYDNKIEDYRKVWQNNEESFRFDNGKTIYRTQQTNPHKEFNFYEMATISYNLMNTNKYMLNASAGFQHYNLTSKSKGDLFISDNDIIENRSRTIGNHDRNINAYLDLYFHYNLKNNQFLALNMVGNYISSKNRDSYSETSDENRLFDYYSGVRGRKYSFIFESIYEKTFTNGNRFTGGIKHTQASAENIYSGTLLFLTNMRQADTYLYGQYNGRWKNLRYKIGIGVTRSWLHQVNTEKYEKWAFSPEINVNYQINNQLSFSLFGKTGNRNPSLAELSDVDQIIDSLQIRRGNPDLRAYNYYSSSFRFNFNKNKFNLGLNVAYNHYSDIIMSEIYQENGKFINTFANQQTLKDFQSGIDARLSGIWNILNISGGITYRKYWSNGYNYHHTSQSLAINIQVALYFKQWTLMGTYIKRNDFMRGETIISGEEAHLIQLQYRIKDFNIGLKIYNPFQSDYYHSEKRLNKNATFYMEQHIDDVARDLCLTLSWNINFGRKYNSDYKRTYNRDTENGIL